MAALELELHAEDCCGAEDLEEGGEAYVCTLPAGHYGDHAYALKMTAARRVAYRRSS